MLTAAAYQKDCFSSTFRNRKCREYSKSKSEFDHNLRLFGAVSDFAVLTSSFPNSVRVVRRELPTAVAFKQLPSRLATGVWKIGRREHKKEVDRWKRAIPSWQYKKGQIIRVLVKGGR